MSSQPKPSKGKGKGARRVSNLSEEQRNKKRENDRIAQQNIRRRNKELIEKLQQEVEVLRKLKQVDVAASLAKQNKMLQDEIRLLRKTLYLHTGRVYPVSGAEVEGLPPGGFGGEYAAPHSFGSPYLAGASIYDQWPSNVMPVTSTATVHSVESSPGASGQGEDPTPTYVHSNLPVMEGAVMTGNTSAPTIRSAKDDYRELDGGSSSDGYTGHNVQQQAPAYLPEQPWPAYSTGPYYSQATAL